MSDKFNDVRCDEIIEWLSRHDVEKFAILDDDNNAGIKLKHSFFKTNFSIGLTDKIAAQIIEHLGTHYDTEHNI